MNPNEAPSKPHLPMSMETFDAMVAEVAATSEAEMPALIAKLSDDALLTMITVDEVLDASPQGRKLRSGLRVWGAAMDAVEAEIEKR